MIKISTLAEKLNINCFQYGEYIGKILPVKESNKKGKLILVTSVNPTPNGEGKTTTTIGLNDAINKLGYKSIACLREPSMGPVFGSKGTAIGGGKSKIIPENEISLHFTGDMHAITSANNLLCAIIDNHIYQGNELDIKEIYFKRCIDINDRFLRDTFVITPASEIMAIVCLSNDIEELKQRINNIIVGINSKKEFIYVRDLKCGDAITILLKDALNPNLVQSIEEYPVIVHGGPFANIAHGCSSLIGTKTALNIADYVITEAGFGSDLGAIKFFDIKCKNNDIYPDAVIINVTVNALKYNGENDLEKGICNLEYHIKNMQKYTSNLVISINKYDNDSNNDINYIIDFCKTYGVECFVSTNYNDGSEGIVALAKYITSLKDNFVRYQAYDSEDIILTKINKICINELGAKEVIIPNELLEIINNADQTLDVCISKTPLSISDDPKVLGYPKNFTMFVTNVVINNGAGFITIMMGNVLTLPGLAKKSNYLEMKIHNNQIYGIK